MKTFIFSGKSEETLKYMEHEIKVRLDRIDKTKIRDEYKLWIYTKYRLPSIRFLLT